MSAADASPTKKKASQLEAVAVAVGKEKSTTSNANAPPPAAQPVPAAQQPKFIRDQQDEEEEEEGARWEPGFQAFAITVGGIQFDTQFDGQKTHVIYAREPVLSH